MEDNNLPEIPEVSNKAHVPMVKGILVPGDLDGLWRLTSIVCSTDIAGDYKGKPQEAFVAIQLGMSVGLNYMQALQSVAVINKKPSLYGDATTAICKASGELEEHDEYWEVGDERMEDYDGPAELEEWPANLKAVVMMKRKGVKQPKISKFSVADAIRMDKWNKFTENGHKSVWQKHPKDMLMWRARHKTQSVVFADSLKGFAPAIITADYVTTDLEPTSAGVYEAPTEKAKTPSPEKAKSSPAKEEKQKVAEEMKFLIEFAQSNNLSLSRLEEFVGVIAKENNTSMAGLIPDIRSRSEEFIAMFKNWDTATGDYVGQPDSEPENSGQDMNDKDVSGSDLKENEPLTEEEEGSTIMLMLDGALEEYVNKTPDAFIDSDTEANFKAYITYCAEMTKRTEIEILRLAKNNPENYCEYFFNWVVANPKEDQEPDGSEEAPNGTHANANEEENSAPDTTTEPDPPIEKELPLVPEKQTKSYSPFVLEFKNMTTPRFKNWVENNKDRLQAADPEDFKDAVRKWEKLRGEDKLKGEWPYPQHQDQINFEKNGGALNARQRVANLKQSNPTECEVARKKLGFATTVSEEAAGIWENAIHEIIEARQKKVARGRKK